MRLGYNFWKPEYFENPSETVADLHDVGVRSACIVFGLKPQSQHTVGTLKPYSAYQDWSTDVGRSKIEAVVKEAKKRGWEVMVKPHVHYPGGSQGGKFSWWSGYCHFWGNEMTDFNNQYMNLMRNFVDLCKPNTICIQNEMMQQMYEYGWYHRLVSRYRGKYKLIVSSNFFQPYKRHMLWRWKSIRRRYATRANAAKIVRSYGYDPNEIITNNIWSSFQRDVPSWFKSLDEIGINAYNFPSFGVIGGWREVWKSWTNYKLYFEDYGVTLPWYLRWMKYTVVDYMKLMPQWVRGKHWCVTEIDLLGDRGGFFNYKDWWYGTLLSFQSPFGTLKKQHPSDRLIAVWDDKGGGEWISVMRDLLNYNHYEVVNGRIVVK